MAERGQALNLLLLGGSGQVGTAWQRLLQHDGAQVHVQAPTRQALDLADQDAVSNWVLRQRPQLIVNAAAYTAVDKAESEPDLAHALNAALPTTLAQAAQVVGASLIHYSTDYVFAGTGNTPTESSTRFNRFPCTERPKPRAKPAFASTWRVI